jgi:hypothetical protein
MAGSCRCAATVAATSAKVWRRPIEPGVTEGPNARDRDVRRPVARARPPLRHGGGVAAHHSAAVDRRRGARFLRRVLHGEEGDRPPEAGAETAPRHHERGCLNQRPRVRREVPRCRLHQPRGVRSRLPAQARRLVSQYAWDEHRRNIQVWTNSYIFQGDTEKEARDYYNYVVLEKGDWPGVENLTSILGINSQSIPAPVLTRLKEHFIAGWGSFPLIGTAEQIVDVSRSSPNQGSTARCCPGRAMSTTCGKSSRRSIRWCSKPGCGDDTRRRSALEDQTRRRSVGEQAPVVVRDPSFGRPDPAAAAQDDALGLDQAGFGRDRPQQ